MARAATQAAWSANSLRQYGIPFIAAGRNAERIQEVMDHVPGIETADYEVVAVENTVEDLTKLFDGAKVVCNIVGPFERFGEPVVQAALGCRCSLHRHDGRAGLCRDDCEQIQRCLRRERAWRCCLVRPTCTRRSILRFTCASSRAI